MFTCLFALIGSASIDTETYPWVILQIFCGPYPNQKYWFVPPISLWKIVLRDPVECNCLLTSIDCFAGSKVSFKFFTQAYFHLFDLFILYLLDQHSFILKAVLGRDWKFVCGTYPNQKYWFASPSGSWKIVTRVLAECNWLLTSIDWFAWYKISFEFFTQAYFHLFDLCILHLLYHRSLILKLVLGCDWKLSVGRIQNGHTNFLPPNDCGRSWRGWQLSVTTCCLVPHNTVHLSHTPPPFGTRGR